MCVSFFFFFFQAEDGIRDSSVTGVQTCALPIAPAPQPGAAHDNQHRNRCRSKDGDLVTGPDPGRLLLDKIDAREQALAREAEQARTMMDDLAARLRELHAATDHLQITRKTLLSLAGEPST